MDASSVTSPMKKMLENKSEFSHSEELVYYKENLTRIDGGFLNNPIHRSMVALTFMDANKKNSSGSGVLISKDTVLTAAQNIYNKELNVENTDFKIYIGANGVAEEYYQAEGWRYPEEFKTCNLFAKLSHNYAIVKLKKSAAWDKYMNLCLACKECLHRKNRKIVLKVFGFPCGYPPCAFGNLRSFEDNFKLLDQNEKRMRLYQYGWASKGKITVVDAQQSKICYKISALPGQSGCPVIKGGKIIAVHICGDNSQFNVGRIVDTSFMNSIWKWREELNAAPFQLQDYNVCKHAMQTLEKMGYKLKINWKGLKKVNLPEYSYILELDLHDNKLRQIDLAQCPRLTYINLCRNQLQLINLANNKHLNKLYLNGNQLKEIYLRANVDLTHLRLKSNKIDNIDLAKNTKLELLDLSWNRLQRVHLWIAENVEKWKYRSFDLSFQKSVCRVDVQCGQTEAVREKVIRIIDYWTQVYSSYRYYSKNISYAYIFLAY